MKRLIFTSPCIQSSLFSITKDEIKRTKPKPCGLLPIQLFKAVHGAKIKLKAAQNNLNLN